MNPRVANRPGKFLSCTPKGYWQWGRIFGIALLVWLIVVMVSSTSKSPAIDEIPHIGAGLTYWKFHDFRMNPEHPPLIKLLCTLPPLLLDKVPVYYEFGDYELSSWFKSDQYKYGFYILFRNKVDPRDVLLHARSVIAMIGCLGAVFAWWWGHRLGRCAMAGALSGLLLCLYPEYAGHSRFVTLDVPTLAACGAISAAALAWWRKPVGRTYILFILAAVVGSLTKLPVTLFTVFTIMTLAVICPAWRGRAGLRQAALLALATAAAGYLTAWAAAGFRFSLLNPALEIRERSQYAPADGDYGNGALASILSWIWRHRLLPETTLATLSHTRSFEGRNYYFMGQWARHGWYSYFFVTLLLKTSIVMSFTYLAAAGTWVYQLARLKGISRRYEISRLAILLVPFLILFGVFVMGRASLGHRYILFVYFPLSIMAGTAMARWWWKNRTGKIMTILVMVANVITFAMQYPHYETYFNEVIRTPYKGSRYVSDSNIDWGQDMPLLAKTLKDVGATKINLAVFGGTPPEAYGIRDYNWILPNYPFALFPHSTDVVLDGRLFTAVSLNCLLAGEKLYPQIFDREPVMLLNSCVLFNPVVFPDGSSRP